MAGRSATQGLESVRRDVNSIKAGDWNDTGIAGSDVSAIGGDGRKGSDAKGSMSLPAFKRIDDEWAAKQGGKAMTGEQGQGGGHGKTL